MKKSQILTLLLAAAALLSLSTACQKTLDRSEPRPSDGGKGYVSLSFNLPAVSGTKSNDIFDAGDKEEYEVKEAIVAFFYGTSESDAVCKYAVRIGEADFIFNAHNGNITTKYRTGALEIPTKEENEKVYVLAVLNPADYISVTADSRLSVSDETDNLTLSKLQEFVPVDFNHQNGFMMTNAPYTPDQIEDIIITLPEVTVYNEKSEAEGAAPTPIYVERVEAKVTLEAESDSFDENFEIKGNTAFAGDKVTLAGWVLQNTNRTYCPVRKTDVSWFNYDNSRFVGGAALNVSIGKNHRIYWAVDGNYEMISDEAELTNNFNIITAEPADWNEVDSYQYCAENTTLAKAMNKKQLTGVLIKATYIPDSFTEGADDFILTGPLNSMYATDVFIASVKSALNLDAGIEVKIIATKGMTVTDAAGLSELMTIDDAEPTDAQATAILSAFGNSIRFYKEGVCYYTSLIRHFDDDETPLTDGSVSEEGEYDEDKHLGRYGVVRNNWYQLTVTSVSGPGEPDIPEIPDEPADARESYINCEINILSWAVREQDVVL